MCPSRHVLKRGKSSKGKCCAKCSTPLGERTACYQCQACSYDICTNCFQSQLRLSDVYVRRACNIHAHALLLLRNTTDAEWTASTVARFLGSFTYISMHHEWNTATLDVPEVELFTILQEHRRGIIGWFSKQVQSTQEQGYADFHRVLQAVHKQFAALDAQKSVDPSEFEWGALSEQRGRYAVLGKESTEMMK